MKESYNKDLVVAELLKEARILKRQLGLVKKDPSMFSSDDIKKIHAILGLLGKDMEQVKQGSRGI